jgi:hypothetical protein
MLPKFAVVYTIISALSNIFRKIGGNFFGRLAKYFSEDWRSIFWKVGRIFFGRLAKSNPAVGGTKFI